MTRASLLISSAVLMALSAPALAQETDETSYEWEAVIRLGAEASEQLTGAGGAFGNDRQGVFGEGQVRLWRDLSDYNGWGAEAFFGGQAGSFRGNDDLNLERLRFERWNGEGKLPWRAELGDVFGYTSRRSFQSPIKGAVVELQPRSEGETTHSIQAFSGFRSATYDTLFSETGDDRFHTGLSYVGENKKLGSWSLAGVYSRESIAGQDTRDEYVLSAAYHKPFRSDTHRGAFEAEIDYRNGDITSGGVTEKRDDISIYSQLSGRVNKKWRYRLRYEHAGEDYRPQAASVTADRTAYFASLGRKHKSGLDWEANVQRFESNKSTNNEGELNLYKFRARLPRFADKKINGSVSFFYRDEGNELNTRDTHTLSGRGNFSMKLPQKGWNANLALSVQDTDDRRPANADRKTRQITLGASGPISLWGQEAFLSPGLSINRSETVNGTRTSYGPKVGLTLDGEKHRFSGDLGFTLDDAPTGQTDNFNTNLGLRYGYRHEQHEISADLSYFSRNPDPGTENSSVLFRLIYSRTLEGQINSPSARRNVFADIDDAVGLGLGPNGGLRFASFNLGSNFEDAVDMLEASNLDVGVGVNRGPSLVYDVFFFEDVTQRQFLSLRRKGNQLDSVSVIFDLEDTGEPEDIWELYDRVQEELIVRYGAPDRTGREDTDIEVGVGEATSIARRRQVTEWDLPKGILRFGMPARTDGTRRFEIRYKQRFGPISDPFWSEENVD